MSVRLPLSIALLFTAAVSAWQTTGAAAANLTTLPATAPTSPGSLTPADVDVLLAELSHNHWTIRERAVVRLAAAGPAVEARLREFVRTTPIDEARDRAWVVLQQIDQARRLGPTRVTLKLKDATVQDAFAALARQAGVPIRPRRDGLWREREFPPVSLDLTDAPFWVAAKSICEKSSLKPLYEGGNHGEPASLVLVPDLTGDMTRPHVAAGAFLVVASSLSRLPRSSPAAVPGPADHADDAEVMLTFYADPRWKVLEFPRQTMLESVSSSDGRRLPKPEPLLMQTFKEGSPIWMMRGAIKGIPAAATSLRHLKGSFTLAAVEHSEPLEIPDVVHATQAVLRSGRQSLQVASVTLKDQMYEVRAILTRGGPTEEAWRTGMEAGGIRLFDSQGKPVRKLQTSIQDGGVQALVEFSFEKAGQADAGPVKLVWRTPLESREMTVPFELTDLLIER